MSDDLIKKLKKGNRNHGPWKRKMKVSGKKRGPTVNCTPKEDTEAAVLKEVMQRARARGIPLWRQPAGKVCIGQHWMTLAPAGAADLTGILPDGRRLEVECKKRYGGIQSEDQKKWQKWIGEMGGVYLLVHSEEEFRDKLLELL